MNKIIHMIYNIFLMLLTYISPKLNTKVYYFVCHKKRLNLKNPQGFNEKICYLKLNDYYQNETINICADKYRVREYVKNKGLSKNLVKLLFAYDSVAQIEWDRLPNKFAIKLNYGCGFNIICKDYKKLDKDSVIKKLTKWLKSKYYLGHSEIQYKNVPKKILIEEFIESLTESLPSDYKFYCFNGEPKFLLLCEDRVNGKAQQCFYDIDGNIVNYKLHTNNKKFNKPKCYDEMINVCKILSKGFPFVRIDLYDGGSRAIFGEMTFTPAGGTADYTEEGEKLLGSLINIEK